MSIRLDRSRRLILLGAASAAGVWHTAAADAASATPDAGERVSFVVSLPARPAMRERMRQMVFDIVDTMSHEPDFVSTWVHEDLNDPNLLVNYETWACSREFFIEHHLKKPYRQAYEAALPELLAGERRIVFLQAVRAYPGRAGCEGGTNGGAKGGAKGGAA